MLKSNRILKILALMSVALVLCAGCGKTPRPKALFVLPGAVDARYLSIGVPVVWYSLTEAYPAKKTTVEIVNRMAALGWKPMKEDIFPEKRGTRLQVWDDSTDLSDDTNKVVQQWNGLWENSSGEVVRYLLIYRATEIRRNKVRVAGLFYNKRMVEKWRHRAKKVSGK